MLTGFLLPGFCCLSEAVKKRPDAQWREDQRVGKGMILLLMALLTVGLSKDFDGFNFPG